MQAAVCNPGIAQERHLVAQRSASRFVVLANPTHGALALPCFSPLAPSEPHQRTARRQMSFYRPSRFAPIPGACRLAARSVQPGVWHVASCFMAYGLMLLLGIFRKSAYFDDHHLASWCNG